MQVSVEATGGLGRRMTVALPAERLESEVSARLQRILRTSRLPGFRPGKAPMKLVEAHYAGKVMEEVAGDLIQSSFYEAVVGQGLKPAGGPTVESRLIERGQALQYTVVFEVYPEVRKLDIAGLRVERPASSIAEEDIDQTIESLRKQRVTWAAVQRAARNGDRLVIDFEGRKGGVPFEGGHASGFRLILGDRTLVDGFEAGLVGAMPGETRKVAVQFPADYRDASLAGQEVDFEVRVGTIEEPVLPAVDAEFARGFGVQDGSVDTLRAEVRASLERELRDQVRVRVRDQVFDLLLQQNDLPVPSALEQAEVDRLMALAADNLEAQGISRSRVPQDRARYADEARRRVALGLILAEIVKSRGLVADPSQVRARVEHLASSYESPQEFIEWHYAEPDRLSQIESLVLEEQVVAVLLETADVADSPVTFGELLGRKSVGQRDGE
ncbi:MAG: trigger factor [Gammaproteobacteria bacterium]|nr:trigger factor [Gammaproteobacteria bacterium]